jgi:hypothetical protein
MIVRLKMAKSVTWKGIRVAEEDRWCAQMTYQKSPSRTITGRVTPVHAAGFAAQCVPLCRSHPCVVLGPSLCAKD